MLNRGPICAFSGCKFVAQRVVGDCTDCGQSFCSTHRLLESHSCSALKNIEAKAKAENAAKLINNATKKASKIDRDLEWCMKFIEEKKL
ncbi:hypothetical protein LTR62_006449 [Meristemomyces frigidus]|uniref:AN1-type domain-containing protein n=1 Tax=Meristemomyces frigidus TaxID=1508187 RepID=A0AAN7YMU2_9PEZI|nr:hypothetical protein LTR62_006449 [Meristemomyces frigidus]